MRTKLREEFEGWREVTRASLVELKVSWLDEEKGELESKVEEASMRAAGDAEEKERLRAEMGAMEESRREAP